MASNQVIDAFNYYLNISLDINGDKTKTNVFNLYQIGGTETRLYTELANHPLVNKAGIVEPYDSAVYKSKTLIKSVSNYTILIYTGTDIKKLLRMEGAVNKNILYIYTGVGTSVADFVYSKYTVDGVINTIYHKKDITKENGDKPFAFSEFTTSIPQVEVIVNSDNKSVRDLSDIANITISRSGLATRVPEVPLLISEVIG